jgi:hypothetical protein
MKRPYEFVVETLFENLASNKENQRYNFNNSEKFMIWVVGFSIGGLSIIVTNLTKFNQSFDYYTIKTVLILLSISIVSGILYRWFFYIFQIQYQNIELYLQGAFSNKKIMEINPVDLSKESDIKEIIRRLKIDFDEDASFILDEYIKQNEEERLKLLNDLKAHYKKIGENANAEFKFAMNYAKGIYKNAFGLSEKTATKMFQLNSPTKFKLFSRLTSIAFLISCISFVAVVILLCVEY